jgi:RNA polymerase sigma-70 factor (ECF subfamily)
MDDLQTVSKTKLFLEEVTKIVFSVIRSRFPSLTSIEGEDIAQEVLIKILRASERGTKIENLRSYTWRVAYTTALDILDVKAREISLADGIESTGSGWPVDAWSVEFGLEQEDLRRRVDRLLETLPVNRRRILKLHLLGLDIKEMAVHLDWTHSKVRHLFYRGLKDLREMINQEAPIRAVEKRKGIHGKIDQRILSRKRRIRPVLSE